MATCNWLLQVYIKTMNYPTTQSSLLERVQQEDEISWNEFYFRYARYCRWRNYPTSETTIRRKLRQAMNHFHSNCLPDCNCIDKQTGKRRNGYRFCNIRDF